MKKKIFRWEILGIFVTIILGFIFHFAYSWFDKCKFSAVLFAVNESVWEHCKIAFWPALFFSIIEYFFIRKCSKNYIVAKAFMLLTIPSMILILFYTYTGIIGYNINIVDISIFFIAIISSYFISYMLLISMPKPMCIKKISIGVLMILIVAFSTFTYYPCYLPLFLDPETGTYGIPVDDDLHDNSVCILNHYRYKYFM
ncbi:MAG: DUF6512 family protein [Eubacteriaceae bacterium]